MSGDLDLRHTRLPALWLFVDLLCPSPGQRALSQCAALATARHSPGCCPHSSRTRAAPPILLVVLAGTCCYLCLRTRCWCRARLLCLEPALRRKHASARCSASLAPRSSPLPHSLTACPLQDRPSLHRAAAVRARIAHPGSSPSPRRRLPPLPLPGRATCGAPRVERRTDGERGRPWRTAAEWRPRERRL